MEQQGYKKLRVYGYAHELVKMVYRATESFPKSELFGLISQMRRAAVSVIANIIEGHARGSRRELRQFLFIANGSLVELEYYCELALDLGYLSKEQFAQLDEKRRMVGSLVGAFIRTLKSKT